MKKKKNKATALVAIPDAPNLSRILNKVLLKAAGDPRLKYEEAYGNTTEERNPIPKDPVKEGRKGGERKQLYNDRPQEEIIPKRLEGVYDNASRYRILNEYFGNDFVPFTDDIMNKLTDFHSLPTSPYMKRLMKDFTTSVKQLQPVEPIMYEGEPHDREVGMFFNTNKRKYDYVLGNLPSEDTYGSVDAPEYLDGVTSLGVHSHPVKKPYSQYSIHHPQSRAEIFEKHTMPSNHDVASSDYALNNYVTYGDKYTKYDEFHPANTRSYNLDINDTTFIPAITMYKDLARILSDKTDAMEEFLKNELESQNIIARPR